jgi:hypothetical protein
MGRNVYFLIERSGKQLTSRLPQFSSHDPRLRFFHCSPLCSSRGSDVYLPACAGVCAVKDA